MRGLTLGGPVGGNFQDWAFKALKQIEQASYEDVEAAISTFTVTGAFTPTYTLNNDTPTTAELYAVISTLITDIQKRGLQNQG